MNKLEFSDQEFILNQDGILDLTKDPTDYFEPQVECILKDDGTCYIYATMYVQTNYYDITFTIKRDDLKKTKSVSNRNL